jgi:hypothetical protein
MFMTQAACSRQRPLTIRQIAEADVIRIRHGWITRVEQSALIQKDEGVLIRTIGGVKAQQA